MGDEREQDFEALQAKRNDILTKLSILEDKRETTKPEIYERVKKDYQDRLKRVDEELSGMRETIEKQLEEILGRKEELSREIAALQDELEELALRHSIGEYTDEVFSELEGERKEKLEPLEEDLRGLEEREAVLKELVAVEGPPKPEEPVEVEAPVAVEEPAEAEEPVRLEEEAEPVPVSGETLAEGKALKESEQELEDLIKELEETGIGVSEDQEEPLEIVEKVLEGEPKEPIDRDKEILTEEEVFKEESEKLAEVSKDTEESESKLGETGLVCKKCGTLNKSDSWYCEKCGAELIETGTS